MTQNQDAPLTPTGPPPQVIPGHTVILGNAAVATGRPHSSAKGAGIGCVTVLGVVMILVIVAMLASAASKQRYVPPPKSPPGISQSTAPTTGTTPFP